MTHVFPRRLLCAALIALTATFPLLAQKSAPAKAEQPATEEFIFSRLPRLVVVGDSLSAGFQNGSLLDRQQRKGYVNLIAQKAQTLLLQPEIAEPGVPNVLTLVSPGPPPIIVPAPGVSTGRTNPFLPVNNLAVPGATLRDALVARPNFPVDSLTDLVLGFPWLFFGVSQSQVEFAEDAHPRTVIVWIGNNDALGAALGGDASLLTPLAQFQTDYAQLINRLASPRTKLIVANIPDVTTVASLITAQEIAAQVGLPLAIIGPILGITAGDYVTPGALPLIPGILANPTTGPLPPNVILNAAEVTAIDAAITNYNAVIAAKVAEKNGVLVDINALLNNADANGYPLGDGRVLTTNFLGGLFSLDGVHPTNTGYAIIANEFINKINARYNTGIPLVNVLAVANDDPLVPGNYRQAGFPTIAPRETFDFGNAKGGSATIGLDNRSESK